MSHKHHILPRKLGGTDDPENLIEVTVEEHAKIHHSLWILGGRWEDELAWRTLSGLINKEEAIRNIGKLMGKKNGSANRGKKYTKKNPNPPQTEEHKKKRIESRRHNGKPWISEDQKILYKNKRWSSKRREEAIGIVRNPWGRKGKPII